MKRNSNGRIIRRCATCVALVAVTAILIVLVDGRQNAQAKQNAAAVRYQSELQQYYSQLPLGHVEDLFGRR